MHTIEERQSLRSSRKYDILMRFYLEERAQSRHHELLVAFLAFQALLIGTAHRWIWRVFIAYFAALLLSSAAIVWKTAEIAEPRESAPWKAGE